MASAGLRGCHHYSPVAGVGAWMSWVAYSLRLGYNIICQFNVKIDIDIVSCHSVLPTVNGCPIFSLYR